MSNAEETARRLRELKRLGVRIAVDDFGTGYSSLAHLRQFPVDVLKIDRSFISQLAEGGEGEILLHTLVQLGKALSIETTAEGIERPQDLSLIRDKDCDNGQGFLFTRPLSAQDADAFFSQWPATRRFEVRNDPEATVGSRSMDRWGLTLPLPGLTLADHEELVKRAEAAGYTDLWTGETAGPDGFTPLALSAAWTERARLGTGIVGVFQRGPALLAQQAAALAGASEGRFVLGIGSSSDRIVEGWNGIPFERPLSKVRETLDFLDVALAGERTETGFKLEQKPAHRVPIVLAALRGKMLELAVERTAGAFTNFLPLAGLPKVTAQLEGAPEGFELLCRFFCIPGEREQVEPLARFMFSSYITVPVYANFYRWLGYGEQIEPMVAGLGGRRPPGRRRSRPLGADRGHVHLRHAPSR